MIGPKLSSKGGMKQTSGFSPWPAYSFDFFEAFVYLVRKLKLYMYIRTYVHTYIRTYTSGILLIVFTSSILLLAEFFDPPPTPHRLREKKKAKFEGPAKAWAATKGGNLLSGNFYSKEMSIHICYQLMKRRC